MPSDLVILFRARGTEVDRDGLMKPPEVPMKSHGFGDEPAGGGPSLGCVWVCRSPTEDGRRGGRTWWARGPTHGTQTFPSHLRSRGGAHQSGDRCGHKLPGAIRRPGHGEAQPVLRRQDGGGGVAQRGAHLIDRGEWTPPKARELAARLAQQRSITLREWARRSIEGKRLRGGTRNRYERALEKRILPELGDIPLKDLTRLDVP